MNDFALYKRGKTLCVYPDKCIQGLLLRRHCILVAVIITIIIRGEGKRQTKMAGLYVGTEIKFLIKFHY